MTEITKLRSRVEELEGQVSFLCSILYDDQLDEFEAWLVKNEKSK